MKGGMISSASNRECLLRRLEEESGTDSDLDILDFIADLQKERDDVKVADVPKEEERHMYVFVEHAQGKISSSLYRIEVPELVSPPPPCDSPVDCLVTEPKESIDPIVQFPSRDYPRGMCCVELNSKLYFLGGRFREGDYSEIKFPRTVHVFDATTTSKKTTATTTTTKGRPSTKKKTTPPSGSFKTTTTTTTSSSCEYLLLKGEIPPMNACKPSPYAFTAKGSIFVYDNDNYNYNPYGSAKSRFEVYQPRNREWKLLPNPPYPSVSIWGHALYRGGKVFLSCGGLGGSNEGHVLCFNVVKHEWLQHFIHGFLDDNRFFGEARLVNDTLYARSGFTGSIPAAFKFPPDLVRKYTEPQGEPMPYYMAVDETDLFDDQSLVGFDGVLDHSFNNWLCSKLVYLGNIHHHPDRHFFCYISAGQFPNDHRPKYHGIVLDYFVPYRETFVEEYNGIKFKCFTGELSHTSHLKINSSTSPDNSTTLRGCFFVSNKIPRSKFTTHSECVHYINPTSRFFFSNKILRSGFTIHSQNCRHINPANAGRAGKKLKRKLKRKQSTVSAMTAELAELCAT